MKIWCSILANLILLSLSTGAIAQISVIDSVTIAVDVDEFQRIIRANIKATNLEQILIETQKQLGIQERVAADKDSVIVYAHKSVEALKEAMEEQRPSWLDRFYVGLAVGVIVETVLIFLVGNQ